MKRETPERLRDILEAAATAEHVLADSTPALDDGPDRDTTHHQ